MKKCFIVLFMSSFLLFSKNVSADVNVQGNILTDNEYQELLESIPEGHELVPNETFNQRAMTGLYGQAHVKNIGWLPTAKGAIGTVGRNLGVEAVIFNFFNSSTSISYKVHVRNEGWHSWTSGGKIAGTTGKNRPIEAIELSTNGKYGVSYRAHVQDYGWLPYVQSGWNDYAGTVGRAKKIEAIQFYLYQQTA